MAAFTSHNSHVADYKTRAQINRERVCHRYQELPPAKPYIPLYKPTQRDIDWHLEHFRFYAESVDGDTFVDQDGTRYSLSSLQEVSWSALNFRGNDCSYYINNVKFARTDIEFVTNEEAVYSHPPFHLPDIRYFELRPGYAIQVPGVLCEHIDRKDCLHAIKYDDIYQEFFWNYGSFETVARHKFSWEKYPARVDDMTPDLTKVDTDPAWLHKRFLKWMGECNCRVLHKKGMYSGNPVEMVPEEFNYEPKTLLGLQTMINRIGQRVPRDLWTDLGIEEYVEPHPFWAETTVQESDHRRAHFEKMLETENLSLHDLLLTAKFTGNHAGWIAVQSIIVSIQIDQKTAKVTYVDKHVEEYDCLFALTAKMRDYLAHRPAHYALLHLYCVTNFMPPDMSSKEERMEIIDEILGNELHFLKQEQQEVHQLLADVSVANADYDLKECEEYPGVLRLTINFMRRYMVNFGVTSELKSVTKERLKMSDNMLERIHAEVRGFDIDAHVIQEVLVQYYSAMKNLEKVSKGLLRNVKNFIIRQPFEKVETRHEDIMGREVCFNSNYFRKYYGCHNVGNVNMKGYSEWGECEVLMVELTAGGKTIADSNGWPALDNYDGDVQLFYEMLSFFTSYIKKPPDLLYLKMPILVNGAVLIWFIKILDTVRQMGYVWMIVLEGKLMTSHVVIRIERRDGGCSFERGLEVWRRYMIARTSFIWKMFKTLDLYLEDAIRG